jgi:hypothetical protein
VVGDVVQETIKVLDDEVQTPNGRNLGRNDGGVEPGLSPGGGDMIAAAETGPATRTSHAAANTSGHPAIGSGLPTHPRGSEQSSILGAGIAGTSSDKV